MRVLLEIEAGDAIHEVELDAPSLTIGGGEEADVWVDDQSLASVHASVGTDGCNVWLYDESPSSGVFVNGLRIPDDGILLVDGDDVRLGAATAIVVRVAGGGAPAEALAARVRARIASIPTALRVRPSRASHTLAGALAAFVLTVVAGGVGYTIFARDGAEHARPVAPRTSTRDDSTVSRAADHAARDTHPAPSQLSQGAGRGAPSPHAVEETRQPSGPRKRYLAMTQTEQREFLERELQRVARMVGNRECAFTEGAIDTIKGYVDSYARRVGNNGTRMWGEDLRGVYARGTTYAPTIIRAFNEEHVPPAIGLYLPVIETEYHNIRGENVAGAAGLFQFLGPTAEAYGVPSGERDDVDKMAPAAAKYIRDRLAEFGTDPVGVGLAVAGYNRSPDSVRRDLHDVVDPNNRERSFWTLVENKERLDTYFQRENVAYVPRFFAAAVIGENPDVFGLDMRPLSTYTEVAPSPRG